MKNVNCDPHNNDFNKKRGGSCDKECNGFFSGFFGGSCFALKNPEFIGYKSKDDGNKPGQDRGGNSLHMNWSR